MKPISWSWLHCLWIPPGPTWKKSARGYPPAIPARLQPWVWIVIAGAGLACLGLVGFLLWRMHRQVGDVEGPSEPIVVDELAEFDRIPADELLAEGKVRELYFLVSEAMRRYIGRRYYFDAMERTLLELQHGFEAANLDESEARLFIDFLARCELVKFAKFVPPDEENVTLVERAKEIVRRTEIFTELREPAESDTDAEAEEPEPGERESGKEDAT